VASNHPNGDTTKIAIIPDGDKIANETITGWKYIVLNYWKKESNIPTNNASEDVAFWKLSDIIL